MKLTATDAKFLGLSEGVEYTDDDRLRAWFAKYRAAAIATKDVSAADAALSAMGGAALVARGVPLDQARAWALVFCGKTVAIAQPIEEVVIEP